MLLEGRESKWGDVCHRVTWTRYCIIDKGYLAIRRGFGPRCLNANRVNAKQSSTGQTWLWGSGRGEVEPLNIRSIIGCARLR
jgi:hypothetical protein